MSAAVVLVIVVVTISAIAFIAFIAYRVAAATTPTARPSGTGPAYKHTPESVKYYGQEGLPRDLEPKAAENKNQKDPRHTPLPRCTACGAAAAYGDEKCRKCGSDFASS